MPSWAGVRVRVGVRVGVGVGVGHLEAPRLVRAGLLHKKEGMHE